MPSRSCPNDPGATSLPDASLRSRLRVEVGQFRAVERRRRFDPTLCIGEIAGDRVDVAIPAQEFDWLDAAVSADLVVALLEHRPVATSAVWLARPGMPEISQTDEVWSVGARRAFGYAGLPRPDCFVITRHGWVDLSSGDHQTWKRLRLR